MSEVEVEWKDLNYSDMLKAIAEGDDNAKTKLAWLKLSGLKEAEVDEEGAVALLEQRVKEQDTDAMWMLGVCCEFGRGIDQDTNRAKKLYKQSREKGNEIAEVVSLGHFGPGSAIMGIRYEFIKHLTKVLPITPWATLVLGDKMNEGDVKMVSELLSINSTLTKLDLVSNGLGDEGAKSISESLMINSTLTELCLYENDIGDEGTKSISDLLMKNSSLTALGLWFNRIGDEGAKIMSKSLICNTTLTTLFLTANQIGIEGITSISESLKVNATLTVLGLGGNNIGEEGSKRIRDLLMVNTTLTFLDLNCD